MPSIGVAEDPPAAVAVLEPALTILDLGPPGAVADPAGEIGDSSTVMASLVLTGVFHTGATILNLPVYFAATQRCLKYVVN